MGAEPRNRHSIRDSMLRTKGSFFSIRPGGGQRGVRPHVQVTHNDAITSGIAPKMTKTRSNEPDISATYRPHLLNCNKRP